MIKKQRKEKSGRKGERKESQTLRNSIYTSTSYEDPVNAKWMNTL